MSFYFRARIFRVLIGAVLFLAVALASQLTAVSAHGVINGKVNKGFPTSGHGGLLFGHNHNYLGRAGKIRWPGSGHIRFGPKLPHQPPVQPPPPTGTTVNVGSFGAVGDGKTDNLKAFQAAIAAAGYLGTVTVPAGTYALSGVVTLNNAVSMVGAGPSTVLIATNPTTVSRSVLSMTGPGATISNLSVAVQYPTANPGFYINGIELKDITSVFVLDHVTFNSLMQAELLINNTNSGTISNNTFNQAIFACIFFHGANNLTIRNNVFNQYGDVAIEGYYPQSTNFDCDNNVFNVQAGDNYTFCVVLGGITNGQILSNQVTVPSNAYYHSFLRIAGSNPTVGWGPVSNIQVAGNRCTNCGRFQSGAIEVEAPAGDTNAVTGVQINNNRITQTVIQGYSWLTSNSTGINVVGGAGANPGSFNGIVISGNNIDGPGIYGIYLDSAANAQISGNTITNCAGTCIGVSANNSGALSISGNSFTNSGFDTASDAKVWGISTKAVIEVDTPQSGPSKLTSVGFTNNSYTGQANNLIWNIDDNVSSSKVPTVNSGNTNQALVPNYIAP